MKKTFILNTLSNEELKEISDFLYYPRNSSEIDVTFNVKIFEMEEVEEKFKEFLCMFDEICKYLIYHSPTSEDFDLVTKNENLNFWLQMSKQEVEGKELISIYPDSYRRVNQLLFFFDEIILKGFDENAVFCKDIISEVFGEMIRTPETIVNVTTLFI